MIVGSKRNFFSTIDVDVSFFIKYIERLVRIFCSRSRNSTELFMNIIHFVIVWRERRHLLTRLKVWRNAFHLFSRFQMPASTTWHCTNEEKTRSKENAWVSLSMLVIYARATSRFLVLNVVSSHISSLVRDRNWIIN